ncbi:hypothetical protein DYB28_011914 [Aphanomyces astaci]|uniref:Uncharacterized protein n=1 Tax=Aphanomyces astaci TaxID=112090 RepID=A0A9X8HAW5_APHAT|nr:hypothetical protein DYB28_011914 [Aphanomyces astaci]
MPCTLAASEVVVTCATHSCNTSGINISFPYTELFDGKSVLEVGSGLGLSGIVAGAYSRRTILTDYQQDTLKALAYNVMLNQTMGTTVEHLDWDHLDKVPCYVELWKSRWSISNRLSGC